MAGRPKSFELTAMTFSGGDSEPSQLSRVSATAQSRRVLAMLERFDHGAVHERQALDHPAVAHHSLRADHALDDHETLDLALEGLRRVLRIRARDLLWGRHGVVELDRPSRANLSTDLPAHHSADDASHHASLDAAFDALVLLDLGLLWR